MCGRCRRVGVAMVAAHPATACRLNCLLHRPSGCECLASVLCVWRVPHRLKSCAACVQTAAPSHMNGSCRTRTSALASPRRGRRPSRRCRRCRRAALHTRELSGPTPAALQAQLTSSTLPPPPRWSSRGWRRQRAPPRPRPCSPGPPRLTRWPRRRVRRRRRRRCRLSPPGAAAATRQAAELAPLLLPQAPPACSPTRSAA